MIPLPASNCGGEAGTKSADQKSEERPIKRVRDRLTRLIRSLLSLSENVGDSFVSIRFTDSGLCRRQVDEI
jgi:hypothetical protein